MQGELLTRPHLHDRLEELTIQLETSHEVNKHLNGEVESLVLQVDELQKENEALKRHTQELTEKVTAEKRKANSSSHSSMKDAHSVSPPDVQPAVKRSSIAHAQSRMLVHIMATCCGGEHCASPVSQYSFSK